MSGLTRNARARGQWAESLSRGRFAALVAVSLVFALAIEEPLVIRGAAPDFVVIPLVFAAIRLGAAQGAAAGFGLGLFRDSLFLLDFGLHALVMTILGYAIGKARETLYLTTPGVDVLLLAGAKLALDVVILGMAAEGAWRAFEERFFWEALGSAVYTALVGGALQRLLART